LDASGTSGLGIDNLSVTQLFPAASTQPFARLHYLDVFMKTRAFLLMLALGLAFSGRAEGATSVGPVTVVVPSGSLKLRALMWRPQGRGPFPAVLFNHGSGHASDIAAGRGDQRHPELLGPVFARHGYVFLYLFRRGDGLSAGQGIPSGDLMDTALATNGQGARNQIQLRLLETDEMNDALAGLAFLRAVPEVEPHRVAVVGVSFGGSLTLLMAERDSTLCAIVAFATAGYSWERSPQLRARLTEAVGRVAVPIFFIHASNDYSVGPGKVLGAEMARLRKPYRVKIYAPVGQTADEGHNFIHLKVATWEPDVFAFLDKYLRVSWRKRHAKSP
jgi:carboxymethylenebutenolidase